MKPFLHMTLDELEVALKPMRDLIPPPHVPRHHIDQLSRIRIDIMESLPLIKEYQDATFFPDPTTRFYHHNGLNMRIGKDHEDSLKLIQETDQADKNAAIQTGRMLNLVRSTFAQILATRFRDLISDCAPLYCRGRNGMPRHIHSIESSGDKIKIRMTTDLHSFCEVVRDEEISPVQLLSNQYDCWLWDHLHDYVNWGRFHFLMGRHTRLGANSSIFRASHHVLEEREVFRLIVHFAYEYQDPWWNETKRSTRAMHHGPNVVSDDEEEEEPQRPKKKRRLHNSKRRK